MYSVAKVFDARYYRGNPDLIINCMISMKDGMLKKFGTVYDDELEWHIDNRILCEIRPYIDLSIYHNVFEDTCGALLGVKVIVEDFPLSAQIKLKYNKRIGDYRMGTFSKLSWDELYIKSDCSSTRPRIKKVIFNKPATIVFWTDGTKTVVKCGDGDVWDEEKGLAMAICKKLIGLKEFYKQYNKATKEVEDLDI